MLVDATDRPIFDEDEGDKDLSVNPDAMKQESKNAREARKQHQQEVNNNNMLDIDDILGGGIT